MNRLLLLLLLALLPSNANAQITCDPSCSGCSGPAANECTSCPIGRYLSGGACLPCMPIAGCTSLTCTNASNSFCSACASGTFLSSGQCVTCTPVESCTGSLTCLNATTSRCSACAAGTYNDTSARPTGPDVCRTCTNVDGCFASETCSTSGNSRCTQCNAGRYLDTSARPAGADACPPCTPIDHCTIAGLCSDASNSNCTQCQAGYWLSESGPSDACVQCTPIPDCACDVTCTSAGNSVCGCPSTTSTSSTVTTSSTSTTMPAGPADACTAAKLRATAKYESRLLGCHATAARKGDASGLSACVQRAEARFALAFAKAGSCTGEQATCDCLAAQCADAVRAERPELGPNRCVGSKLATVGRWAERLLRCNATAAERGTPVDPECVTRAFIKFRRAYAKLDDCGVEQANMEAAVGQVCVASLGAHAAGGANVEAGICASCATPDPMVRD